MLPVPTKYSLVSGQGEGPTNLNAFDKALLDAGLGNVNLLKVSSILPPGAIEVKQMSLKPGSLVPVAYGSITCNEPGTTITAAAAVGVGKEFGVIMECSGKGSKADIERKITSMVRWAFEVRNMQLMDFRLIAVEHTTVEVGSVFAGVVLWY